jgi:hypothetical protein
MIVIGIGVFLIFAGMLAIADKAIWGGRLSGRRYQQGSRSRSETLEPRRGGARAFRIEENWLGLALMALGGVLLLIGAL